MSTLSVRLPNSIHEAVKEYADKDGNITDEMVKDAPTIEQILPKVMEFFGDSVLVAHNADFDLGFLKHNANILGIKLENTYLDTLRLSKDLFPDFKKYKLGLIAEKLGKDINIKVDSNLLIKVINILMKCIIKKIIF